MSQLLSPTILSHAAVPAADALQPDPTALELVEGPALYSPAPPPFAASFSVLDLDGSNGFRFEGDAFSQAGYVGAAGDLNHDGLADMVVGSPFADANGNGSGAVYVIYGRADGYPATMGPGDIDGDTGFLIAGLNSDDHLQFASSAGDINGDGFSDLVLSNNPRDSESWTPLPQTQYVLFGSAKGFPAEVDLGQLDGKSGFTITSTDAHSYAGRSVAAAGDVNGDGFDDLIVGASSAGDASYSDYGVSYAGAAYVVYGKGKGVAPDLDLAEFPARDGVVIRGGPGGAIGSSVASAGDVNGDGFGDLLIGAPSDSTDMLDAGSAYVVFGDASLSAHVDVDSLDGTNGFRLHGLDQMDSLGISVASAGDINGDGFDDVMVGAFAASTTGSSAGATYVIFGKAKAFDADIDLSRLDGLNGFEIDGARPSQASGSHVCSAGDINGDGFDDMLVAAAQDYSHGYMSGAVYVVFGRASGFKSELHLADLNGKNGFVVPGVHAQDFTGGSVAGAGDVNGDGLDDIMVGAPPATFSQPNGGASYVIFGQAPTTAVRLTGTAASQSLVGGEQKDTLSGVGGDDMLWGHGGKDKLAGGSGNDTLIGGAGKDVLAGGAGDDVFAFREIGDSTAKAPDTISDLAAGDRIDLSMIDTSATSAGDQAFHLVANFTHHAGELTVTYNAAKDQTLVQGDVNGDGGADLVIVISGDHHDFTDFVL